MNVALLDCYSPKCLRSPGCQFKFNTRSPVAPLLEDMSSVRFAQSPFTQCTNTPVLLLQAVVACEPRCLVWPNPTHPVWSALLHGFIALHRARHWGRSLAALSMAWMSYLSGTSAKMEPSKARSHSGCAAKCLWNAIRVW